MASSGENRASLDLDPLSKTQENRINHIIDQMLVQTGNKACQHHGESRHDAKEQNRANGAKGSHQINQGTPKSEATEDKYKSCFHNLMQYTYNEFGVKDPMQITGDHVKGFCAKLIEAGYSRNSFEGYTKAFSFYGAKGGVLDQYMQVHGGARGKAWDNALQEARGWKSACVDKEHFRAYKDPRGIIDNIKDERCKIAASLQAENGLRISDATHIKTENWNAAKGEGVCNSKGGQAIHFKPSPEVAKAITAEIKEKGVFKVSHAEYYQELRGAVAASGQVWESSHGLRAAFAVANMYRCKAAGMSYQAALRDTGEKLGHHRPADEVTKTYVSEVAAW